MNMSLKRSIPRASRPSIFRSHTRSNEEDLQGRLMSDDERKSLPDKDMQLRDQVESTIETLDYISGIADLEPKFSNLMDDVIQTAITLCNFTNDRSLSSACEKGLIDTKSSMGTCWSYLNELSGALQFHIHEAFAYHKFHLELIECKQNFEDFKQHWHSKWIQNKDRKISETVHDLNTLKKKLTEYKQRSEELSSRSLRIAPLHLRRTLKPRVPHSAVLLVTICLEDGTWLERGSTVVVSTSSHVSTTIQREWQVEVELQSGRKKVIRLPSSILWLLSPETTPKSGSTKCESPELAIAEVDKIEINHLNNRLASAELYNEIDSFYCEVKDEYRQDVLVNLIKGLKNELDKSNGPIKAEDLKKTKEMLHDANSLTLNHPVNHTELVKQLARNLNDIQEHLIQVEHQDKPNLTKEELDKMYKPLKAWKDICDDETDLTNKYNQTRREAQFSPSKTSTKEFIKKILDSQLEQSYNDEGLTCLADLQNGIQPEDLHKQLKHLSRNASIRRSRNTTTSFTHMSPRTTPIFEDSTSHYNHNKDVPYGDPNSAHLLPCPCKYCGLKSGQVVDNGNSMIEIERSGLVHAALPGQYGSTLPRYPLDELPQKSGRDRGDDSSFTEKDTSMSHSRKDITVKGTGRFKIIKKPTRGQKSGHASDDYTSGIDSAIDSGAETTIYEQDAPLSEEQKNKSKIFCPPVPSSNKVPGKKTKKPIHPSIHGLVLPEPPEQEMVEIVPHTTTIRRLNEVQPEGTAGYSWINEGTPIGLEIPQHPVVLLRQESPLLVKSDPTTIPVNDQLAKAVGHTRPSVRDIKSPEQSQIVDPKKSYEDSTILAIRKSKPQRPTIPIDQQQETQLQKESPYSDDDTDDFSQMRPSEYSETLPYSERNVTPIPGQIVSVPPAIERTKRSKFEDKTGKPRSFSRGTANDLILNETKAASVHAANSATVYTEVGRALSKERDKAKSATGLLTRGNLINSSMQAHSPEMRKLISDQYFNAAVQGEKAKLFDAYIQARQGSSRNGSFKNHRIQAGYPAVNKTVRAVGVQISSMNNDPALGESIVDFGSPKIQQSSSHFIQDEDPLFIESAPTNKMYATPFVRKPLIDDDDYDSMTTDKLDPPLRTLRMKRRAKRVQCGESCVEKKIYSTSFQIGPRTLEQGVDAQSDLLKTYVAQYKSPGLGKKMQVGETLEDFRKGQSVQKSYDAYSQKSEIALSPIGFTEAHNYTPIGAIRPENSIMMQQAPGHKLYEPDNGPDSIFCTSNQTERLPMSKMVNTCLQCGRSAAELRSKRIQKGSSQIILGDDQDLSACWSSPMAGQNFRSKLTSGNRYNRHRSAHDIHLHITFVDNDDSSDDGDDFCNSCRKDRTIHLLINDDNVIATSSTEKKGNLRSRSCSDLLGSEKFGDKNDHKLIRLVDRCGITDLENRLKKIKEKKKELEKNITNSTN